MAQIILKHNLINQFSLPEISPFRGDVEGGTCIIKFQDKKKKTFAIWKSEVEPVLESQEIIFSHFFVHIWFIMTH